MLTASLLYNFVKRRKQNLLQKSLSFLACGWLGCCIRLPQVITALSGHYLITKFKKRSFF